MKCTRFLFFAFIFTSCLFLFPVTALSEGGYQFVTQWGSDPLRQGQLRMPRGLAVDALGNVYVADWGNHCIQKFSSSGVFITKWGSEGSGDGQFRYLGLGDIAVDASGNVYVSDRTNNRIQKFSSAGVFMTKWGSEGSGDGQFSYPEGIAVDISGNVYVADKNNNRIQKFDSTGQFITKWGGIWGPEDGQFRHPAGLTVDVSGDVYVIDFDNSRIQKFSPSGVFIAKWGSIGSGEGQFVNPRDIVVDASGYVYVTGYSIGSEGGHIQKFSSSGSFIAKWDSQNIGNGQLSSPHGIDVDAFGNVYVADTDNNCILKFSSSGVLMTKWGLECAGDGQLQYPESVAVDSWGYVYVADSGNHRIQKFSSSGSFITKWGSEGSEDGQFYYPHGIAIDGSGNVYVTDSYNYRIQKFSSTGEFITKWGSYGTGDRQFCYPQALTVDASGNVYILDSGNDRIQKFSSDGSYITQWRVSESFDSTSGPIYSSYGIAIDTSGNVYVADLQHNRIQKYSSSGSLMAEWGGWGSGDGQFFYPYGVAVDASGNVYVAEMEGHRIQKFSSSGNLITKWGTKGTGNGQFLSPSGVAVDSAGNVYVVDSDNWNVQKFAPVPSAGANTNLYFPHVVSDASWRTEIAIINAGDRIAAGMLRAFSDEGRLIEAKDIALSAHGRRQIDVAAEFADHADIGYIIFETNSVDLQGYAKFYREGVYRAAVPAVKVINTSDIFIPHIASDADWWTGISLVNTTSATKELTMTFSDGQTRNITLNANQHDAFSIREMFDNQSQPDIQSAVIFNANGIIGLEIFGSIDGNRLEGMLLTDKMASTLNYPHVAGDGWWTGVMAYNPSDLSCKMTVTPYDTQGTALTPSVLSIAGKKKYVGAVSDLGFPAGTAWFKLDSARPLTGFELFSPIDNQQLAAYAGVGASAKEGIFPKIEKNGWTDIVLVNTEVKSAYVSLTAYDDKGAPVDGRAFIVGGHAKVVKPVEEFFLHDISGATYIVYSSDRNIVGFQLNGSADGAMLDGLPALAGAD